MLNTSDAYNAQAATNDAVWHGKATVSLKSGVVLNLTDSDILSSGIEIADGTSDKDSFEIGAAIIGELTLKLNNFDGKFDAYDFTGATIVPYIGLDLPDDTTEWLRKGFFTVNDSPTSGTVISITALDNMSKFDTPYLAISTLAYPATLLQILNEVCTLCGVSLATTSFINSDYSVTAKPSDDTITCREMISYAAQLAGCFARINNMGALELRWYDIGLAIKGAETDLDGGSFTDHSSGDAADGGDFFNYKSLIAYEGGLFKYDDGKPAFLNSLSSCTLSTDIVRVTGVQIVPNETDATTYLCGSDGYVISIENNPLAQDNLDQVVANLGAHLVGFEFMPLTAQGVNDPKYEAGDVAVVSYRGNKYTAILSNLDYVIGEFEEYSSDAESESERNSDRSTASAKAVETSKNYTDNSLTGYDLSVRNLSSLMANALGFYETSVTQGDGSKIEYMHDKPTLAESLTIWKRTVDGFAVSTDGGATWNSGITADGNAIIKILTALGINADWINTGTLQAGLITSGKLQSKDGSVYFDLDNNAAAVTKIVSPQFPLTFITIGEYESLGNMLDGIDIYVASLEQESVPTLRLGASGNGNSNITGYGVLSIVSELLDLYSTGPASIMSFYVGGTEAENMVMSMNNSRAWILVQQTTVVDLSASGNVTVTGNLNVHGTKNCALSTKDYGVRTVNSYETAGYYFGDIGHDTVKDGKCVVPIEPIFAETVNLDVGYEVFLTPYGKGQIYVSERTATSFTIEGDDIDFGWELKAKRVGYENDRLEEIKD